MVQLIEGLKRLTLVVPTYRRQDFALRLMAYWSDKGVQVLVLDGTSDCIETSLLAGFSGNIRYIHSPVGIYDRIRQSLPFVQTEYVALAGDDEFYIPSALACCIDELEGDSNLVACCGRSLGFRFENSKVFGRDQYRMLRNYAVIDSEPELRLTHHMGNYVPSLTYAVCRADVWTEAFSSVTEHEFPFFAAFELQFEMIVSVAGKSKVIPELMWLRSHGETTPTRGTDVSLDPEKRFPAWWKDPEKADERELFFEVMSRSFSRFTSGSNDDLRRMVTSGCEVYLEGLSSRHRQSSISRRVLSFVRQAVRERLPEQLKSSIKSILSRHISRPNEYRSLLEAARLLEAEVVVVDFAALNEIRKTVTSFHLNRSKHLNSQNRNVS